ncbi:MAG: hypothetical protein P9E24_01440 [Candidatus Competibacter sp.]|nr:hypothetical protein [Candidatus Competibacter sp.]MDG4585755.1 hypothetical protein [Candidatus Competibacter sp.]
MFERSSKTAVAPVDNGLIRERARFAALWERRLRGGRALAETIHARLVDLYGEAHRRYHTLDHVRHCLSEFDRAAVLMDDPDAVEMALWFHDAIYRSGAVDNERRSAELFRQWSEGHADAAFLRRVDDLIMVTTHRDSPACRDERFIVDIDLSSFGLPWDAFERDGRRIRAECADIGDEVYYPGQLRFLLSLQSRPTFFLSEFFQRRYERIARDNIRRVIENLRARGYG